MARDEALNRTGRVLLGLVASGVVHGYEMTRTVDRWTRHFWGASVSGIYPELRRLQAAGLLERADDPRGAQARHAYALTDAGRDAWSAWLTSGAPAAVELRHEGVLKLFFGEALGREGTAALLRRLARQHEETSRGLAASEIPADQQDSLGLLALRFGVDLHAFIAAWSQRQADALEERA